MAALIQTFTDVPPTHAYYHYIEAIVAVKITGGTATSPPTYSPDANCLHEQLRIFLMRGKAYVDSTFDPEDNGPPDLFTDVPSDSIYRPWIQRAAKWGVDGGAERPDRLPGELGYGAPVTRGQAASLFVRALGELPMDDLTIASFSDVAVGSQYFAYVERLYRLGITAGTGGNPPTYSPNAILTRAQMAVFVKRAFNIPFVTLNPPES